MSAAVKEGGADAPSSLFCRDCGAILAPAGEPIDLEVVRNHWKSCQSAAAFERRKRVGLEPDWLPLSHTAMVSFDACELQHSLGYGPDRVWVDSGDAANLGNELHALAEAIRDDKPYEIGSWLPLGEDDDYHFMKAKLEQLVKREIEGWPMLTDERATYEAILTHDWEVRPGLRAEWRGKIDWLVIDEQRGIAWIIDWKTGRKIDYEKDKVQRKEYALAVIRNHPGVWKVYAKTIYLRFGKAVPHQGGDVFDAGDVEQFAVVLEAKVRRLARVVKDGEEPKASPGEQCRLCDYAHKCPAAEKLLTPLEIHFKDGVIQVPKALVSEEEIQAAALALFQLDKLAGDLKKALKTIADKRPIEVNGGSYRNWKKSAKRVRDLEAVIDFLRNQDVPYTEFLNFNHQTGKKFLEDFPQLEQFLVEVEDRYPEFRWKKDAREAKN